MFIILQMNTLDIFIFYYIKCTMVWVIIKYKRFCTVAEIHK